jgi:hypothetical protein
MALPEMGQVEALQTGARSLRALRLVAAVPRLQLLVGSGTMIVLNPFIGVII